jgi:predicted transcriptional regulator
MAVQAKTKTTLLNAIALNARTIRDSRRTLDNLICRAVERGITQGEVAKAAGVSQAHVSRTLDSTRKANETRKAQAATRRKREGGKV